VVFGWRVLRSGILTGFLFGAAIGWSANRGLRVGLSLWAAASRGGFDVVGLLTLRSSADVDGESSSRLVWFGVCEAAESRTFATMVWSVRVGGVTSGQTR
jgi:hypothetical protein